MAPRYKKTCAWCTATFKTIYNRQKFCDEHCKQAWLRQHVDDEGPGREPGDPSPEEIAEMAERIRPKRRRSRGSGQRTIRTLSIRLGRTGYCQSQSL